MPVLRSSWILLTGALLGLVLTGCESKKPPPDSYIARVGDHYLQKDDLSRMLDGMGPVPDSTQAREQVIGQWVENTLLLREAERLNLAEDSEVKRRLQEQRQNALVTALKNRIYEDIDQEPTEQEVRTYFERHRKQLTLREPYVQVRHLTTTREDSAQTARRRLLGARESDIDSVWAQLSREYASRPDRARQMADQFLPESRLFTQLPYVRDELSALREGEVAPVVRDNNRFHVLQLVGRAEEGSAPKLKWVEGEIRRRLRIRHRKQMYAREVQRLRNRAKADNLIDTP
jgi:parvulin-like peptidyl-prolyl isomerase